VATGDGGGLVEDGLVAVGKWVVSNMQQRQSSKQGRSTGAAGPVGGCASGWLVKLDADGW